MSALTDLFQRPEGKALDEIDPDGATEFVWMLALRRFAHLAQENFEFRQLIEGAGDGSKDKDR